MKKLILLLISLGLTSGLFAQVNKGNVFLGSQFFIDRKVVENPYFTHKTLWINIEPIIEIAFSKHFTTGTYFNINLQKDTDIAEETKTQWVYDRGLTPFFRYYYSIKNSHPYVHVKYGLIFQGDYYQVSTGFEPNQLLQKPAIGIGYMHSFKNICPFVEINQGWTTAAEDSDESFVKEDFQFEFGLKFCIPKKEKEIPAN